MQSEGISNASKNLAPSHVPEFVSRTMVNIAIIGGPKIYATWEYCTSLIFETPASISTRRIVWGRNSVTTQWTKPRSQPASSTSTASCHIGISQLNQSLDLAWSPRSTKDPDTSRDPNQERCHRLHHCTRDQSALSSTSRAAKIMVFSLAYEILRSGEGIRSTDIRNRGP